MQRLEEAEDLLKRFFAGKNLMTTLETKTEAIDSEDLKKIDKNESVFRENISEAILDIEMHVANKLIEWTIPESIKLKILN